VPVRGIERELDATVNILGLLCTTI